MQLRALDVSAKLEAALRMSISVKSETSGRC